MSRAAGERMDRSADEGVAAGREGRKVELEQIIRLMAGMKRGRVLEIPCGSGSLAGGLAELGFDVQCADIDRGLFTQDKLNWRWCNMNDPLPFEDGSFDYVTTVAGMHRVHYPESVVAEFARVLRPGGLLLLSMWNHGSIRRRLRFLATGSLAGTLDAPSFQQTVTDPAARFRQILTLPRLVQATESAGFVVEGIKPSGRIQFRAGYLFWLPVLWLAGRVRTRNTRRETRCDVSSRFAMQLARSYLIIARRP